MSWPQPTPRFSQGPDCVTHFKRHEHRLKRRVLHWYWVIEDHHHAVTSVSFERAVVLDDDFADGRMVVAQQGHHVFRIGAFSEPGEPAQVTEERRYLSTMAFELLLAPRSDDQISNLRRQEAPQPAHALDFVYLVGDTLFELLSCSSSTLFNCSLAQFLQSRVFSMAITAWAAKFVTSSICFSVKGRTSWR